MARSVQQPPERRSASRLRYPQLVRPGAWKPTSHEREAQRYLRRKESRWAPIAYAVFLLAIAGIFSIAYTTYVFSKYRGEVLPGVYVDRTPLGGLTERQARTLCESKAAASYFKPVRLTYNALSWNPRPQDIGLTYDCNGTASAAMGVGRTGSFLDQLVARLPVHPSRRIGLEYQLTESKLRAYVEGVIAPALYAKPQSARLEWAGGRVHLTKSSSGRQLDVGTTLASIHSALGYLSQQTRPLTVLRRPPAITDAAARTVLSRVNAFLNRPPVIAVGKRVFVMRRADFASMFQFKDAPKRGTIDLTVDSARVQSYVANIASTEIDRSAQDAKVQFSGGKVTVVRQARKGRQLDRTDAYTKLVAAFTTLKPNTRMRWKVTVTAPPVDQSNPADLGITTLLNVGSTSFAGASTVRLQDLTQIAGTLNDILIRPNETISFNYVVGTGWQDEVYTDQMQQVGGRVLPGDGGAMQQMATTFFRALFGAGLTLTERHGHTYRLPWYEPPYGQDAIVSPARNWDLSFRNNTGKYLLIETRVEPVKQQVYVYLYGPRLRWSVTVDTGKVTQVVPPPPKKVIVDPLLPPQAIAHRAFALPGGTTVVQRLVTLPDGTVQTTTLRTTYLPRQAVDAVGSAVRQRTATPRATGTVTGTPGTPGTVTTRASPTPTFNH